MLIKTLKHSAENDRISMAALTVKGLSSTPAKPMTKINIDIAFI